MDQKEDDKITAFDTLFTTNHIQMMKIIMPHLDRKTRKQLAVFIKFQEFQYTLSCLRSHSYELSSCSVPNEPKELNVGKICTEILPYCTREERGKVEQIANLFRTMEMYKEMSQTMELMKDLFPESFQPPQNANDGGSSEGSGGFQMDISDLLMNMLSPEQKSMFEMFGGNNNESERMDE